MVCGFGDSVSYDKLVRSVTGVELDKSSRFTDWSRRPLSEKQLTYALADVTHLRDIYRALKQQVDETDRWDWVEDEMEVLRSIDTYVVQPEDAWERLKMQASRAARARRAQGARRLARARGAGQRPAAQPRPQGRRADRARHAAAARRPRPSTSSAPSSAASAARRPPREIIALHQGRRGAAARSELPPACPSAIAAPRPRAPSATSSACC